VNLIGEHTDYNDGFVLPVAIDRQVVVAAGRRGDDRICAVSHQADDVVDVDLARIGPGGPGGWGAYTTGVAWVLRELGVAVGGTDLVFDGNVPGGSGLSSSAALECATAVALDELWDGGQSRSALALAGQRAENEVVGAPVGAMDQMASMLGRRDHALFLDTRSMEAEQIPAGLEAAGLTLVVIDTRAPHANTDGAYAERRSSCEAAARELGARALRDVTPEVLDEARARLGDVRYRRARHVVTENARVLEAVDLLRRGDVERLGPLLAASHASLRDDFEVSSRELDVAVAAALEAGAVGARMTGAGFGGSALALVPDDVVAEVLAAVPGEFARAGLDPPDPFVVAVGDGARRLA
jgi:galactokinase